MLVEVSIENFLSFNERVTLSLVAAPELDAADGLVENTFEAPGGVRLLKSALVYGANASGKSNLVKAVSFARRFVLESAKESQAGETIGVKPFLLQAAGAERGSSFELVWFSGEARYRYGFTVDSARVLSEGLWRVDVGGAGEEAEVELFRRDVAGIVVGEGFAEGRGIESKTRDNALFLSVVAQFNGAESQKVVDWFRNGLALVSRVDDRALLQFTLRKMREGALTQEVLRLAREADLGISAIDAGEVPEVWRRNRKELGTELETLRIRHQTFDSAGQVVGEVDFDLRDESQGTRKLIALAGPLVYVLKKSTALFFDELDARLHPRLTRAVVGLFHGDSNPGKAQLVAATHDTNLLDRGLIRRDQIWFTEKDARGATKLYSLAEFDLPSEARYERDYLLGKFGAVPVIGDLVKLEAAE